MPATCLEEALHLPDEGAGHSCKQTGPLRALGAPGIPVTPGSSGRLAEAVPRSAAGSWHQWALSGYRVGGE